MKDIFNEEFEFALFIERNRIEGLEDSKEKQMRKKLFIEAWEKINAYINWVCSYKREHKTEAMIKKGILIEKLKQENGLTLKEQWEKLFAYDVSNETKERIYFKQYFWHIFSFNEIGCYCGNEAKREFNKCIKGNVNFFYQYDNEGSGYLIKNASLIRSEDFDWDDDIYIFDAVNKWTYIHTHEAHCGPYFLAL